MAGGLAGGVHRTQPSLVSAPGQVTETAPPTGPVVLYQVKTLPQGLPQACAQMGGGLLGSVRDTHVAWPRDLPGKRRLRGLGSQASLEAGGSAQERRGLAEGGVAWAHGVSRRFCPGRDGHPVSLWKTKSLPRTRGVTRRDKGRASPRGQPPHASDADFAEGVSVRLKQKTPRRPSSGSVFLSQQ